jgi:hypothetical protein
LQVLTEHLMTLPPTAIGFRHMEQTNAGAGDIRDTVTGRDAINEINLRTGSCGYKDT